MASTDIFNGKASVPDWVAKWWEFDQAVSDKILSHDLKSMTKHERFSVAVQLGIIAGLTAGCLALARDQQAPSGVDQLYSPSGELVPLDMFGQSEIFYSVQAEFIDLGLVAQQVQVVQLDNSDRYTAMQIMEVQDADGEKFYNLMFQGKDSQVKQKWAVLVDNTLFELDLVTKDGKREFVSNLTNSLGELTPTQLILDTPEEDGEISIPGFDVVGFFSGVRPVLAADEATSTPIPTATFTATKEPTFTPFPSDTPFVVDISPTKIKVTVAPTPIPATPIPPEVPTPFTEADGTVRPDFIPSNSYYIGSEHWVTPPTLNDCRAGRENDPKFQLDPQFVYSDTAPATDKYPPGVYFECEFSGTGLNKVTITTVK